MYGIGSSEEVSAAGTNSGLSCLSFDVENMLFEIVFVLGEEGGKRSACRVGWLPLKRGGATAPLLAKTLLLVRIAPTVADGVLLLRSLPRLFTGGALVVQGSIGVTELV